MLSSSIAVCGKAWPSVATDLRTATGTGGTPDAGFDECSGRPASLAARGPFAGEEDLAGDRWSTLRAPSRKEFMLSSTCGMGLAATKPIFFDLVVWPAT